MSTGNTITFRKASTPADFEKGKQLFVQYIQSLNFALTFQDLDRELAEIAIEYNAPAGALLLAFDNDKAIACAGVRKIDGTTAELKRMFVDPTYRGLQLGQKILQQVLDETKQLGYTFIRLDTVPEMLTAIKLYKAAGFYEIEPYRFNPIAGAIYMEKKL